MKNYNGDLHYCSTEDELKKAYREACKKYHPDRGGSKEAFQALQDDYERIFETVKGIHRKKDGSTYYKETGEKPRDFLQLINALLNLKGLTIEVLGSFLWIGGKTKQHAAALKKLGLKYATRKKMWYKAPAGYHRFGGKEYTIQEIRATYKNKFTATANSSNASNAPALSY